MTQFDSSLESLPWPWANSVDRDCDIEISLRHRRRTRNQEQRILAIGDFANATFWQRRPAFAAVAAFAYSQGVRPVK
jgi:hypothetical protein